MAYAAWEREHDANLIKTLTSAKFVEEQNDGDITISLAHLRGYVSFCDGVMSWGVSGFDIGGEERVDQSDIDGSAAYLQNYGRKAVRNNLERVADKAIASAKKRMGEL